MHARLFGPFVAAATGGVPLMKPFYGDREGAAVSSNPHKDDHRTAITAP
jgi:hypothetical protein